MIQEEEKIRQRMRASMIKVLNLSERIEALSESLGLVDLVGQVPEAPLAFSRGFWYNESSRSIALVGGSRKAWDISRATGVLIPTQGATTYTGGSRGTFYSNFYLYDPVKTPGSLPFFSGHEAYVNTNGYGYYYVCWKLAHDDDGTYEKVGNYRNTLYAQLVKTGNDRLMMVPVIGKYCQDSEDFLRSTDLNKRRLSFRKMLTHVIELPKVLVDEEFIVKREEKAVKE